MPSNLAFLLLLFVSLNLVLGHNEDPREDMDLLDGVQGLPDDLPEEIRRAFNEDTGIEDTVKLIDVNVPESKEVVNVLENKEPVNVPETVKEEIKNVSKEPLRRKQSNPILEKFEEMCLPKLDLVFLLDTSGSIQRIYQEHVRWAVALVDSLPIEPDTVRVAAVQYSGFPLTEFALGTYPSVEDVRKHLENIRFRTGVSRTGYALRKAEAELFRPDRGARDDAVKVIVLFTDGTSVDDPQKPAQQLRDLKGVKIYVVSLKPDTVQMNKVVGSGDNIFGPTDLKRLRDVLITEAERTRACIRIGNGVRPFKSRIFNGSSISNWLTIGQNSTKQDLAFKNDLKDITELSRAAAAIAAARPGTLEDHDRPNDFRSLPTVPVLETKNEKLEHTGTVEKVQVIKPLVFNESTTIKSTTTPLTTTVKPTSTFTPFLGVRVVEEMDQDVFENPNQRPVSQRQSTIKFTTISPITTQPSTLSTRRLFKEKNEKFANGRQEFTSTSTVPTVPTVQLTTTLREAISIIQRVPIIQQAVPLFQVNEEKTIYVPTWLRTTSAKKAPLTVTSINRLQTQTSRPQVIKLPGLPSLEHIEHIEPIQSIQALDEITQRIPQLNPAFPTLRPIVKEETTTGASMLVTRPKISRVNAFPGVTCPHDILFVVDSSGSLHKSYDTQKAYLRDILSRIDVGNETHRVALLQFAGYRIQKTEWTYNSFVDSPTLMKAVDQVRYLTGTTFIGAALNSARQILEQRRKGIPSLVILLSDGFSQDDAIRSAEQIRRLPMIEFYALSVSEPNNMPYLKTLVGSGQNVFSGSETEDLKHLILNRLHCRF